MRSMAVAVLVAASCSACGGDVPSSSTAPVASSSVAVVVVPPAAPTAVSSTAAGAACGALGCRTFDSPRAAFETTLASHPIVVGIGEAHAQKSAGDAKTVAKRFTETLLPALAGRASDLLVELMMPPSGCQKATEEVRTAHKPVTEKQSEANQNDYVGLGEAARKIGIVPDLLRPSCADLAAVSAAGPDAVTKTLETIARLSTSQVEKLLARKDRPADAMIVLYGGALHNDRNPPAERAAWSYGTAVSKLVSGKYVEIDIFAADLIGDDDSWKRQPWFSAYDKDKLGGATTLFTLAEGSFVIVLPRS